MPLIEAKNISLSYQGKKVTEDVSFCVEAGECLCIVGENGTGKTTLLKALTGLKKIDSGSLVFSEEVKKSEIGYLPQQTDVQKDFPASVREVVMSGCVGSMGFLPFYTKEQKLRAKDAMEKMQIANLAKSCYHTLSGGQQQRVLLARALCAGKKLLILDEPTSALDSGAASDIYRLIGELTASGVAVILISHDIKNAVSCAHTVLHMGDLKPLFYGKSTEYKNIPAGMEV